MAKKNKAQNTDTPETINPDHLVVLAAYESLPDMTRLMIQELIAAGDGSYLKPLPAQTNEQGKGVRVPYQIYRGSGRKYEKAAALPDHRSVAAGVKRGLLIKTEDDKGLKVVFNDGQNSMFRTALSAAFASA